MLLNRMISWLFVPIVIILCTFTALFLAGPYLDHDSIVWKKVNNLYADIIIHITQAAITTIFAMLGAVAKNLINRDEDCISLIIQARQAFQPSDNSDANKKLSVANSKKFYIFLEVEKINVAIGAIFGIVGYFILSSKFLIRLLYPEIEIQDTEVTLVGLAIIGLGFGYFAREFAGASTEAIEKKLAALNNKDSEVDSS